MRRRRIKYTWFPVLGTAVGEGSEVFAGFPFNTGSPISEGLGPALVFPLIPDVQPETADTSQENLVDFLGSDYVIKRIVGKLFAFAGASSGQSPPCILFGAGIFVARSDSDNRDVPAGGKTQADADSNFGVLSASNIREPWMWRRTWQLRNRNSTLDFDGGGLLSTYTAGSIADGPHVDCKVSRRVRNDERLWMCLQAGTVLFDGVSDPGQVDGFVDLRFLGALRKAKNRSAF